MLESIASEVAAVARASQPAASVPTLTAEVLHNALSVARATASNHSSMLRDVERGVPTEIDFITGYVVQQAEKYCVPVPVNYMLFSTIHALNATAVVQPTALESVVEEVHSNKRNNLIEIESRQESDDQVIVVHTIEEVQQLRCTMQTKGNSCASVQKYTYTYYVQKYTMYCRTSIAGRKDVLQSITICTIYTYTGLEVGLVPTIGALHDARTLQTQLYRSF